jgi:hypothetical protein
MYHPSLIQLLNAYHRDEQVRKNQQFYRPKQPCQCCYCKSQKQKQPESSTLSDVLKLFTMTGQKIVQDQSKDIHHLFLQYIQLLGQSEEKNVKLAHALCDFFDIQREQKEEIKKECKKEIKKEEEKKEEKEQKVDPKILLNQIYTGLTGQTLSPTISDLVTNLVTKKEGIDAKKINGVLDDVFKNLGKEPPKDMFKNVDSLGEADSILNEFIKQDQ